MASKKTEGSRSANMAVPTGPFDSSFRTKGADSPVQRYRKKHPHDKPLKKRHVGETPTFQEAVVAGLLGLHETVRKRGAMWVIFDDHTGVQVGAYKSRKDAWSHQRVRRQQDQFYYRNRKKHRKEPVKNAKPKSKSRKTVVHPSHTPKVPKSKVGQAKRVPTVKGVRGIKGVKPIKPIHAPKPIHPKGVNTRRIHHETFVNSVAMSILHETKYN
jgi:hypothetical protein